MSTAFERIAQALSGSCPGMSPSDGDETWCKLMGTDRPDKELE
jgi:hypothetical protein